MKLNEIRDNAGATKTRMRVGRGIGSGKGKTGGPRRARARRPAPACASRASKAARCRCIVACPSAASTTSDAADLNEVNLGRVQAAIEAGKLDAGRTGHGREPGRGRRRRRPRDGVKLLGVGDLSTKVTFEVTGASKSAVEAVEKAGGSVNVLACRAGVVAPAARPEATRVTRGRRSRSP